MSVFTVLSQELPPVRAPSTSSSTESSEWETNVRAVPLLSALAVLQNTKKGNVSTMRINTSDTQMYSEKVFTCQLGGCRTQLKWENQSL